MIKDLIKDTEERMKKTLESMDDDFKTVRTGRASPALVERVMVTYYGAPTPLNNSPLFLLPNRNCF